jgi:hypothetical protein
MEPANHHGYDTREEEDFDGRFFKLLGEHIFERLDLRKLFCVSSKTISENRV